jgi:hypothetical protein
MEHYFFTHLTSSPGEEIGNCLLGQAGVVVLLAEVSQKNVHGGTSF